MNCNRLNDARPIHVLGLARLDGICALRSRTFQIRHTMTCPPSGNFANFIACISSPALRAVAQHWHEARGQRRMPSWDDIPFSVFSPYDKLLWAYAYDPNASVFTGRFTGPRWGKWAGTDFPGKRLEDIHSLVNYRNTHSLLTVVATTP